MTINTEISNILMRLDALERNDQLQNMQWKEIWEKQIVISTEMSGMREQQKAHSEKLDKELNILKSLIIAENAATKSFANTSYGEVIQAVDKFSNAFGFDKDPNALYKVQKIFEYVENQMQIVKDRNKTIRNKLWNWGLSVGIGLLVLGCWAAINDNRSKHNTIRLDNLEAIK